MRLRSRIILALGGVVLVAVLLLAPQFNGLRLGAMSALSWPGSAISNFGDALHFWKSGSDSRLTQLTDERNALVLENARLRALGQENQEMRELLEVRERNLYHLVSAQIIGKAPEVETQALILDRGTADGITQGLPVVASEGFFMGKITQVTTHTSVLLLVTDGRSRVAATILNDDRTLGYVEGGGGLGMAFRLIPQHEQIQSGDTVITSGLEAGIPRGLVIGRVGRVSREPQEPFQTAVVNQVVVPEQHQIVGIILPQNGL